MFNDGEVHFSFSETTDTGLTYSATVEMEAYRDAHDTASADSTIDESSLTLSTAEMGSVTLGENDDVTASFATYLPGGRNMATGDDFAASALKADGTAVGNGLSSSATGAAYGDTNKVAYRSPNFGGLQVGMSYSLLDDANSQSGGDTDEEADTSMGFSYSTEMAGASVRIAALTSTNGEDGSDKSDKDAYGISVTSGAVTLAASSKQTETGTTDVSTVGYGIGYAMADDISVAANMVTSEDDESDNSMDTVSLSFSYTIAPGLNFAVAMNSYDYDNNADDTQDMETDEIRASIQANF